MNLNVGSISRLENIKSCNMKNVNFISIAWLISGAANLIASLWHGMDYAIFGALLLIMSKLELISWK